MKLDKYHLPTTGPGVTLHRATAQTISGKNAFFISCTQQCPSQLGKAGKEGSDGPIRLTDAAEERLGFRWLTLKPTTGNNQ
ncbi:unnamed protein product [Soboliphyme baturini]|uniref:DNA primase n=1 Tax=Soboliphyme baturini TaxID=241478 RepID=A0A183J1U0_9BILA|nr:unnamed protein product [Soboliphyme baturini]